MASRGSLMHVQHGSAVSGETHLWITGKQVAPHIPCSNPNDCHQDHQGNLQPDDCCSSQLCPLGPPAAQLMPNPGASSTYTAHWATFRPAVTPTTTSRRIIRAVSSLITLACARLGRPRPSSYPTLVLVLATPAHCSHLLPAVFLKGTEAISFSKSVF